MPKKYKRTILAGAGISIDAPSNIPFANIIIQGILKIISPNNKAYNEISNFKRKPVLKSLGDFIRFEMLLDTLCDTVDKDLTILDFLTLYNEPNQNHYNLAKAAIDGDIVITPNFDTLIEQAIIRLGYIPYSVCYDSDYSKFALDNTNCKIVPVYKIHGSIKKYYHNGKIRSSKSTIQATLSSINNHQNTLLLPKSKLKFLNMAIKLTDELLVCGYSGSDDFDIMPSLLSLQCKKVTWIEHASQVNLKNVNKEIVSCIRDKQIKDKNNLDLFLERQDNNLIYYKTLTSNYLQSLYKESLINRKHYDLDHFKSHILNFESKYLSNGTKYLIIAELFYRLSEYSIAKKYYKRSIRYNDSYDFIKQVNLISCLIGNNQFKEAKSRLENLKDLKISDMGHFAYAKYLRLKPYVAERSIDKSDSFKFIIVNELYIKAIEFNLKMRYHDLLAELTNDYALFNYDFGIIDKAEVLYKEAINYDIKSGNIRHMSWVRYNLACLYFDEGQFYKSEKLNDQAFKISEMIGDIDHVGNTKNLEGMLDLLKGKYLNGIKAFRKSIHIDYERNDFLYTGVCWHYLGNCFAELERWNTSDYCFEKSEQLHLTSSDKTLLCEMRFSKFGYQLIQNNLYEAQYTSSIIMDFNNTSKAHLLYELSIQLLMLVHRRGNHHIINRLLDRLINEKMIVKFLEVMSVIFTLQIDTNLISDKYISIAKNKFSELSNKNKFNLFYVNSNIIK